MKPYEIILQQLGGNEFKSMTGAHNFIHTTGNNGLQFRFRGSRRFNWCKISLNERNLYDVEFCQIGRAPKFIVRNHIRYFDIYASDLQSLFTSVTGLNTHL